MPSATGANGGRAVVVPVSWTDFSVSLAVTWIDARRQAFPWHGPMESVVYRLSSSMESKPSSMACFISFTVTSMHRQVNCLPGSARNSEPLLAGGWAATERSEEHTSELQSHH